jgi:plasmid rolling circle replication initiator protein Rep
LSEILHKEGLYPYRKELFNLCTNHSTINPSNSTEILKDIRKSGKEVDWAGKKKRSLLTAEHFEVAGLEKKAELMRDCADTLVFKRTPDALKLYQAWFCKVRLCPMCNWRRSLKIAYHNKRIVETVNERHKVRWLFLTLTVKNTDAESLQETLTSMFKGFQKLTNYKAFKTSIKGYFRALEVTKNRDPLSDSYGTYHPHFHVLLAVPPSYFTRNYIKQEEWTSLWQKAMKLDYKPIVHIQKVKPKENLQDIQQYEDDFKNSMKEQNAIFEVSKYPVKDTDVIRGNKVTDENVETVLALDSALAYKRLIGYGGLLKEIHKELNLGDAEDGDLIRLTENDEIANGTFDVIAKWHIGLKQYTIRN